MPSGIRALICFGMMTAVIQAGEAIAPAPIQATIVRPLQEGVGKSSLSTSSVRPARKIESPSFSEEVAAQCENGSLLFSRGDCLAVRLYTGSRYTHVAAVIFNKGIPWVYDSTSGRGVRKLSLEDYLTEHGQDDITLFHPRRDFTPLETATFRSALENELGRKYSVFHFVTGRATNGMHCAEYLTKALMKIEWLRAKNPANVSPASLLNGITLHHVYQTGDVVIPPRSLEPIPEVDGWCASLWQNTTLCVSGTCRQMSRWFLCQ